MRKNLLFLIADQWRADALGCAGHPVVKTPNLDALAEEGVRFERCFVQTAPCGPSRMCIFTGRYLCSHRAIHNKTPLMDAEDSLPTWLREAGYAPHLLGYNDYAVDPRTLPPEDPRTQGLSYDNVLPGFETIVYHEYDSLEYFAYLRERGYPEHLLNHSAIHKPNIPDDGPGDHLSLVYPAHYAAEDSECRFLTNQAIDFVEAREDAPWVLNVNYIKPHPPRVCPAPFHEMYDPGNMPRAARGEHELDESHPYLRHIHTHPELTVDRELRETQANYYGMISEVDTALGLLFDSLKASGQWDRTTIVFSSDHGEYLGDHYLTGKGHFYDGAMHVPLIIRDPSDQANATRGTTVSDFVESIDIAPTVLDALEIDIPDRVQGRSLWPRVTGGASGGRREIHYEKDFRPVEGIDEDRCLLWVIRDDRYKYVQFADELMAPLLYDIQEDPDELDNLASRGDVTHLLVEYCQRLLRWRMAHEDQRMERWASTFK